MKPGDGLFVPAADYARACHHYEQKGFALALACAAIACAVVAYLYWPGNGPDVRIARLGVVGGGGGPRVPQSEPEGTTEAAPELRN